MRWMAGAGVSLLKKFFAGLRVLGRESANAPAGEQVIAHDPRGNAFYTGRVEDSGEKVQALSYGCSRVIRSAWLARGRVPTRCRGAAARQPR